MVKNCDRVRGQHSVKARGHSFSRYGPTLSRPITCLSFFFFTVNWQIGLQLKWVCLRNLPSVIGLTRSVRTIRKSLTQQRKMY